MKSIELYTPDGLRTLKFRFNEPVVEYNEKAKWCVVRASGRTVTVCGNPFIVYDEDLPSFGMPIDFSELWKNEMNDAYKDGKKALTSFLPNGTPILTFFGDKISLVNKADDYCQFMIDDKMVCLYKMSFLILSKN